MNTLTDGQQRVQTIRLPEGLDRGWIAGIESELHSLDSIINLQLEGNLLKVTYTFPAIDFSTIWQLIKKHSGNAPFSLTTNLACTIKSYTEAIERQHLLSLSGWDIYVRDIFVASHLKESAHCASQKRKPWQ